MILFLLFLLLSCESIVWKKGESLPYKIAPGEYNLTIYELDYPEEFEKKELFLKELETNLTEVIKSGKKLMLLFNEKFMKDHIYIEKYGILPEENFLRRAASLLSEDEKAMLFKYSGERAEKKQEILNLQIKFILRLLNREEEFEEGKRYTELFKGTLLDDIAVIRRRIVSIFKNKFLYLFVKLDSIYKQEEEIEHEYRKHYYVKDIKIVRSSKFNNSYKEYSDRASIVIDNLESNDVDRVLSSEVKIGLKEYILMNKRFSGYISKGSITHLVGGEEHVQDNNDYKITFNIVNVPVSDLKDVESEYVLNDLYKTKESIEKERERFLKSLEKLKKKSEQNSQEDAITEE